MFGRVLISVLVVLLSQVRCGFAEVPAKVMDLLATKDRAEIPCKIHFRKPVLMFEQRYAFEVSVEFSHKTIESGRVRHPQFLLKVSKDGQWLEGESFEDFKIPQKLKNQEVEYFTSIYLKPGTYMVVMAIFDADTGKANVYHHEVTIHPLRHDPFPEIDAVLPSVEFPDHADRFGGFWVMSRHPQAVPIANDVGTRLDVVLAITNRMPWRKVYRMDVETMLEAGNALVRLVPPNGCVRLSIIDVLRTQLVLDRFPAERLDWKKLQEEVEGINQDVVNIRTLENRRNVAKFTNDFLRKLAADKQGCGEDKQSPEPMIVVVSPDLLLPSGNETGNLTPLERNLYVYLHFGWGRGWSDGMGEILSSAKPTKIHCSNPREFRKALAKIAAMISGGQPSSGNVSLKVR